METLASAVTTTGIPRLSRLGARLADNRLSCDERLEAASQAIAWVMAMHEDVVLRLGRAERMLEGFYLTGMAHEAARSAVWDALRPPRGTPDTTAAVHLDTAS